MSSRRHRIVWTPGPAGTSASHEPLAERLSALGEDRASCAADLVQEASRALQGELQRMPEPWGWDSARELVAGLFQLREAHGWRGPVARWFGAMDELVARGEAAEYQAPPRELLAEEFGLWLGGEGAGESDWSGEPLAEGRRLPDRARVAGHLVRDLERGEVLLVHGFSRTVLAALEEAQACGLSPEVILTEGGPDLGGRRMARRLVAAGVRVRMVYDAALFAHVGSSDRVLLGVEALGAEGLVTRIGSTALLSEARRREVPTLVLATSDKVTPCAECSLPAWSASAEWMLWENAPEGVRVESQAYEIAPQALVDHFLTEHGQLSAAELALRALTHTDSLTR